MCVCCVCIKQRNVLRVNTHTPRVYVYICVDTCLVERGVYTYAAGFSSCGVLPVLSFSSLIIITGPFDKGRVSAIHTSDY